MEGGSHRFPRREPASGPEASSLPPGLWQPADSTPAVAQAPSARPGGPAGRPLPLASCSELCLSAGMEPLPGQVQPGSLAAEVYTAPTGSGGRKVSLTRLEIFRSEM